MNWHHILIGGGVGGVLGLLFAISITLGGIRAELQSICRRLPPPTNETMFQTRRHK